MNPITGMIWWLAVDALFALLGWLFHVKPLQTIAMVMFLIAFAMVGFVQIQRLTYYGY